MIQNDQHQSSVLRITITSQSKLSSSKNTDKTPNRVDELAQIHGDEVPLNPNSSKEANDEVPLNATFWIWYFLVCLNSFIFVLCCVSNWAQGAEKKSVFSWPIYGVINKHIKSQYISKSGYVLIPVSILVYLARIWRSRFQFPQDYRNFVTFTKIELDLVFGYIISYYLAQHANDENGLIVFAFTSFACLVSAVMGFLLGLTSDCIFSIFTTFFTSSMSYIQAKSAWQIYLFFLGCQISSFIPFIPFTLGNRALGNRIATNIRNACGWALAVFFLLILVCMGLPHSPAPAPAPAYPH